MAVASPTKGIMQMQSLHRTLGSAVSEFASCDPDKVGGLRMGIDLRPTPGALARRA